MHLTYVLLCFTTALFIYWIFKKIFGGSGRQYPPGPYGIPILGYLPFLGQQPHLVLTKLGSKYGSVFSIQMGSYLGVVLNDWTSIKAALVDQSEVFSGRPILDIIHDVGGRYGIIGTDGKTWKEQRRFSISRLRDLGFGKRNMEAVVQTEVDELCHIILKNEGSVYMKSALFVPLLNVIWGLIAGKRFDYNDESLSYFKNLVTEFICLSGISDFLFIPQIFINMGLRKNLRQKRKEISLKLLEYMESEVKSHRATISSDEQRDFLDSYLLEIDKQQNMSNSKEMEFSEIQLKFISLNFFLAGVETTANTLGWAILFMTLWPEVQEKIRKEMNIVFGKTRLPTLEDRSLLPYTTAVIMEVQRMASIVPLSIAHRNMKATDLLGHHIPKDCVIIPNLWNVSHDPKLWGDPENFRPERFLNEDGTIAKPEYFIPFSAGARRCLGETLAKMELFMFFSSMIRRFHFKLPPGSVKPDLTVRFGVTLAPPDYQVIAEKVI